MEIATETRRADKAGNSLRLFFGSSMVEQSAVNRWVVGSSPIQRVSYYKLAFSIGTRMKKGLLITIICLIGLWILGVGYINHTRRVMNNTPKETTVEINTVEETITDTQEVTESTSKLLKYTAVYPASNIYDWVDPDTGVHYLVLRDNSYHSGRGGITPRLNSDGTVMVEE